MTEPLFDNFGPEPEHWKLPSRSSGFLGALPRTAWLVYVRGDMGGPATRSFGAPPLSAGASVFGLQETEHKAVPVDAVGIGWFLGFGVCIVGVGWWKILDICAKHL